MNLRLHCPTVYGPVQSRRHGLSLGINLGDPHAKICTWGCIYCQCGFGSRKEAQSETDENGAKQNLPTVRQVIEELREATIRHPNLDSVTMAGNSEPTAHPQFLEIVRAVLELRKETAGRWIFNCLSNGSELANDRVVEACDALDEIWVKFDCGVDDLFKRLNRPVASVGTVDAHIERIRRLAKPRLQSLFWTSTSNPEIANWTEANRKAVLDAYLKIRPVQIFMTTVDREPAFPAALPIKREELEAFGRQVRELGLDVRVFA